MPMKRQYRSYAYIISAAINADSSWCGLCCAKGTSLPRDVLQQGNRREFASGAKSVRGDIFGSLPPNLCKMACQDFETGTNIQVEPHFEGKQVQGER